MSTPGIYLGNLESIRSLFPLNNFNKSPSTEKKIEAIAPPKIISDDWGRISVEFNGKLQEFKDAVLLPNEVKDWRWDWKNPSMQHRPGIRIEDIEHFIMSSSVKPDVVILSRGRGHGGLKENPGPGVLEVDSSIVSYIKSQGISEVHILKTAAAIEKYNDLVNRVKKVAALIHTTC